MAYYKVGLRLGVIRIIGAGQTSGDSFSVNECIRRHSHNCDAALTRSATSS